MNYVWEAALAADKSGIPREALRFRPVRNGSPYAEVVFENLNTGELQETWVEVNPLYRFAKEFSALFDINLQDYEQTRLLYFDVVMHALIQMDLRQGFLLRDLMEGVCGSQAARVLERFEKTQLRRLLRLVLKLYECGSSIYLFKEVMRCLYPDSLVYASNEAVRQVLIYVGVKETKEEREKLEFLQDMFLPINYQVFLFWEHHFGIIDVEEMVLF